MNGPAPVVKILLVTGLVLIAAGLLIWLAGNKFSWLGRLPGDIRIVKENYSVYIPVTTMILISAVLSLVFWLVKKF
jgi:hypothetical protein